MPCLPRRCCCISRRVCLYGLGISVFLFWATIALVAYATLFHVVLPARRAFYLETAYLDAFKRADFSEGIVKVLSKHSNGTIKPYGRPRIQRLVQDVQQLHYWQVGYNTAPMDAAFGGTWTKLWYELLGMTPDGLGKSCDRGKEFWVYLGGTHEDPTEVKEKANRTGNETEKEDPTVFNHPFKRHSCSDDPKYICDSYNEAFNRISERWHSTTGSVIPRNGTSKAKLRFIDCDISTLFCDSFLFGLAADPVMLLHIKIGDKCVFNYQLGLKRCPVTWRFIGLPQWKAPWTRQIRIPLDNGGSTVVPAFPSAEEQLWSLMAYDNAYEALEYGRIGKSNGSWNVMAETLPVEDPLVNMFQEIGVPRWGWVHMALQLWASDDHPDWYLRICEATYWIDRFLAWWDGQPGVVRPLPTEAIEKQLEQNRGLNNAWKRVQKESDEEWEKLGLGSRPTYDDDDDDDDPDDDWDIGEDYEDDWSF